MKNLGISVFFTNALELSTILLLVHELAGRQIPFGLLSKKPILDLAALLHGAIAMTITCGLVRSHGISLGLSYMPLMFQRVVLTRVPANQVFGLVQECLWELRTRLSVGGC